MSDLVNGITWERHELEGLREEEIFAVGFVTWLVGAWVSVDGTDGLARMELVSIARWTFHEFEQNNIELWSLGWKDDGSQGHRVHAGFELTFRGWSDL